MYGFGMIFKSCKVSSSQIVEVLVSLVSICFLEVILEEVLISASLGSALNLLFISKGNFRLILGVWQ